MKKLLAMALAVAMVLALGVTAFAAQGATVFNSDNEDEFADTIFAMTKSGVSSWEEWVALKSFNDDGTDPHHDGDVVNPDSTVYVFPNAFRLHDGSDTFLSKLADKKYVTFKFDKDKNAKMVKSVKLVEKNLTFTNRKDKTPNVDGRFLAMEFKFNKDYSDDEFKITGDATLKFKKDITFKMTAQGVECWDTKAGDKDTTGNYLIEKGTELKIPVEFWVGNSVENADQTYDAGTSHKLIKPIKNDENEWEWEDENRTIARVTFDGDDNQTKAYTKLSTVWDNAFYAENFADQDAFIFDFVAGMNFSATSRATLELYCPFVDEDGHLTVEDGEWTIFEKDADGNFVDVTSKWTLDENDNGDYMFSSKTRSAGAYIIAGPKGAAEVEEAAVEPVATGIVLSAYAR